MNIIAKRLVLVRTKQGLVVICKYPHTYIHTYIYIGTYTYIHIHMYICIHSYVHIHMYIYKTFVKSGIFPHSCLMWLNIHEKFFVIPFRGTKITKIFYLKNLELYGTSLLLIIEKTLHVADHLISHSDNKHLTLL